MSDRPVAVALEVGQKRAFAIALDWPGWARSGRSADEALAALAGHAERYARVAGKASLAAHSTFEVVEQLAGDATTDFGAPGATAEADARPLDDAELDRQVALLRAAWRAFDDASLTAGSQPLRRGPRGGGRDVPRMMEHVLEAEAAYLSKLGSRRPLPAPDDPAERVAQVREAAVMALRARAVGHEPETPNQVRERWPPRYWVRRSAWHALDHAWEIEDRLE